MSNKEISSILESAQWEAEYGDNRDDLLMKEKLNASLDIDDDLSKPEIYSVWISKGKDYIVPFQTIKEAFDYAKAFLYSNPNIVYIRSSADILMFEPKKIIEFGKTADIVIRMFYGTNPIADFKKYSSNAAQLIGASTMLKVGNSETITEDLPIYEYSYAWLKSLSDDVVYK